MKKKKEEKGRGGAGREGGGRGRQGKGRRRSCYWVISKYY
jgi:hypothetical protein